MEDNTGQPKEISKFNEGLLQIQRLDYLWRSIELSTRSGHYDPSSWKYLLDSVWRELYADVEKQSDKNNLIQDNKKFILKIQIAELKNTPNKIYSTLNARHEFLKLLQTKVGKGGSYADSTENEFE